jgi:hypothetical protein
MHKPLTPTLSRRERAIELRDFSNPSSSMSDFSFDFFTDAVRLRLVAVDEKGGCAGQFRYWIALLKGCVQGRLIVVDQIAIHRLTRAAPWYHLLSPASTEHA